MTVFTEGRATAEFMISEARGFRSRDAITIVLGQGKLAAGTVLSKLAVGAATAAAKSGGNTGNGTVSAVTVLTGAKAGVYTLPLLHTWSLAVEEQFYFLFPVLMLGLARFGAKAATWTIGGIAIASLVVSIIGVAYAPSATFYLLPARGWEILLGALVARGRFDVLDNPALRQTVAAVGAALIVIPIFAYTEATPFPGLAALPPCLGTAMLIAAGTRGSTAVGSALSVRPMVFVGLISYSLYLWHWPVIVLMQEALPAPNLERIGKIAAFSLSFGLAYLSWRYVEQPFRVKNLGACLSSSWSIGLKSDSNCVHEQAFSPLED
jgi:peptidoglycan/LPS O-acetylase OafA/YrhL